VKYLVNPDIAVGVKSSTRRTITVDGSVKNSGSFPVSGPLSLLQAVALSGGASEDANLRRVAVFRTIGGQRQAYSTQRYEVAATVLPLDDIRLEDATPLTHTVPRVGYRLAAEATP